VIALSVEQLVTLLFNAGVAVSIIMAGFLAGGLGLIFGPTWWLFWVGAGAALVGGLLALGTRIFDDWY